MSESKVFEYPVRVQWEDTDAGGVVYHANYIKFMERARSEALRADGLNQRKLESEQGIVILDRKSTRLNSTHDRQSRMPSSA